MIKGEMGRNDLSAKRSICSYRLWWITASRFLKKIAAKV